MSLLHASTLRRERIGIAVLAAVQFVNLLDFMIVMPLGPDFVQALGMEMSQIGTLGGAYTLAAAVSALLAARFLDRWGRRAALLFATAGLLVGTVACALSNTYPTLLAARIVAGVFGGPATSLALAAVSDLVPEQRRGRAMGSVAMGFALASVLGVPLGLELARWGDWRTPFWVIGGLGLVVIGAVYRLLPPLRDHVLHNNITTEATPLRRPAALWGLMATASTAIASFLIIPNISPFIQFNLGYPRDQLSWLYLAGGLCSLVTLKLSGRAIDQWGVFRVVWVSTLIFTANLYWGYIQTAWPISVLWIFVIFMVSASTRNVANTTQVSRIPAPQQRARFMALNSAVLHAACAVGAMGGAYLLGTTPSGALHNMPTVGTLALLSAWALPPLTYLVERQLRQRAPE